MNRTSKFTPEIAQEICTRLAEGESLRSICEAEHMPTEATVRRWAVEPDSPFATQYARAREAGYTKLGDELLDIADDSRNDYMTKRREDGAVDQVVNREVIARSQLRIETRKWMLARMLPKVYGDRVEVAGDQANPIQTVSRIEVVVVDPKGAAGDDPKA